MRDATSNNELGLLKKTDSQLIKALAEQYEPCVLVSWDNKMVKGHAGALAHFGVTLAVVDEDGDHGALTEEEYYREVVHRWAHRMTRQPRGSVVKYNAERYLKQNLVVPSLAAT